MHSPSTCRATTAAMHTPCTALHTALHTPCTALHTVLHTPCTALHTAPVDGRLRLPTPSVIAPASLTRPLSFSDPSDIRPLPFPSPRLPASASASASALLCPAPTHCPQHPAAAANEWAGTYLFAAGKMFRAFRKLLRAQQAIRNRQMRSRLGALAPSLDYVDLSAASAAAAAAAGGGGGGSGGGAVLVGPAAVPGLAESCVRWSLSAGADMVLTEEAAAFGATAAPGAEAPGAVDIGDAAAALPDELARAAAAAAAAAQAAAREAAAQEAAAEGGGKKAARAHYLPASAGALLPEAEWRAINDGFSM
jgi:hypothetical protein